MLHYLNPLPQHFLKITHGTHKGQISLGKQNTGRFQQWGKKKTQQNKGLQDKQVFSCDAPWKVTR